MSYIMMYIYI